MYNTKVFDKNDFKEFLPLVAGSFKIPATGNHISIPPQFGSGYFWVEKLPSGITVLVADTCLKNELIFEREESAENFYILQFNELTHDVAGEIKKEGRRKVEEDIQSFVKLTNTLVPETFVFNGGVRFKSVKFFFNSHHLVNLLGKSAMQQLVSQYFPGVLKNENLEPIATEYRIMLNDLWIEKIDHPLKMNYIQNRVSLLLEKFILNLHCKKDTGSKKLRRSDDETVRLMKIEALLLKDFSVAPPTIDELGRISAMSPTKLKNEFKATYGLPIYEYYQKNRMIKAKSLLLKGQYTIREVGMMVGYSNLSHFASTFKKEFGFLPSEISETGGILAYNG